MNVLIVGSGGREHALAWKTAQSEQVDAVYVAPGNAGTALEAKCHNVAIDVMDFTGLADFATENNIGLTIIGPEAPLVDGVVDFFNERGLRCFGPSKGAAQLEGSKAFTKDFLARHNIERGRQPRCHTSDSSEIRDQPGMAALIQHADKEKESARGDPVRDHDEQPPLESIRVEGEYADDHETHVCHGSVRHQLFQVGLNSRHP